MAKQRMLVTGGSGYLGGWVSRLARNTWDVTATYSAHPAIDDGITWRQLDIRNADAVTALVRVAEPDVVVHTAALNPGQGSDFTAVNVTGSGNVAIATKKAGARLIHISTDLVFDGQRGNYTEQDLPNPVTPYGETKANAEQAVIDSGVDPAIVRTSLIYGWRPTVSRSIQWMIDATERGEDLQLWSDEMRCPIWVESLAAAVVELAATDHRGPIHIAGSQAVSRYEFGLGLLTTTGIRTSHVTAIPSPADQVRPLDCTMDSSLARALLTTPLPGFEDVIGRGGDGLF